MKEILLIKNLKEKIYRLASFAVTEEEFNKHDMQIKQRKKKNNIAIIHALVRNNGDRKAIVKNWSDGMEIVNYNSSKKLPIPEFSDAEKEKASEKE